MTFGLFDSYFHRDTVTTVRMKERIRINLPTIYICNPWMSYNLMAYGNCDSPGSESYNNISCPELEKECPDFCKNGMCKNLNEDEKVSITCPKNLYGQCIAINADGSHIQTFTKAWTSFLTGWNKPQFNLEMYVRPPGSNDNLISLVNDQNYKDLKRPGIVRVFIYPVDEFIPRSEDRVKGLQIGYFRAYPKQRSSSVMSRLM